MRKRFMMQLQNNLDWVMGKKLKVSM